jgi:hypothetical protein
MVGGREAWDTERGLFGYGGGWRGRGWMEEEVPVGKEKLCVTRRSDSDREFENSHAVGKSDVKTGSGRTD